MNSRATKGLILLDKHLATGTESTYTFTKTLDMKTTYREIYIIMTGKATATLNISMKLNAHTDYDEIYLRMDTTTVTGGQNGTAALINIVPTTLLDGAEPFHAKINIWLDDTDDQLVGMTNCCVTHEGLNYNHFSDETSVTSITSIEFLTSTSTWIAGTEISIYGLRR